MGFVEGDGLVESVENAFDFFVGEQTGKGEAAMIINGDMEAFDAGPAIAQGAIAGGADAGALEAAQLLDVEVEKIARMRVLVALRRRLGRFECGEAMEAVAAQDAGKGGFGNIQHGEDLGVGTALAAQRQDVSHELGTGPARLMTWDRGTILELGRETVIFRPLEPAADGPFADVVGSCDLAQGEAGSEEMGDHFGSHSGGKSGISVHVVRGVWRWV
jgi:hypothetical protein